MTEPNQRGIPRHHEGAHVEERTSIICGQEGKEESIRNGEENISTSNTFAVYAFPRTIARTAQIRGDTYD